MDLLSKRQAKKMTQLEIARKVGITESFYCFIENKKKRPSVETAKKIAKVLDFDWTEFFEDPPIGPAT